MILQNLDPTNGLCNGARAILINVTQRVLEVRLIGGQHAGKCAFIPRITLSPPVEAVGFHLSRRQFALRLAFAMTINKSQGQSVKNVGIHFQTPVFTHGQFYLAMTRCTSGNHIKILLPEDSTSNVTKNIVFSEALLKDTKDTLKLFCKLFCKYIVRPSLVPMRDLVPTSDGMRVGRP